MKRRGSFRTAVLTFTTIAVLAAVAGGVGAASVEWHDSTHPQALRGAAVVQIRSGDRSAWSTIAAASETAGGVMRAVVDGSNREVDGGSLRSVVLEAVSCVLRAGWMVTKGVPLPRAAAGAAVQSLVRAAGDENGPTADGTDNQTGATGEVDNERSHDAHSR